MAIIEQTILGFESRLLDNAVRKNPDEIRKILAPDFIEFCASGKIYKYKDGDMFDEFTEEINYRIHDFSVKEIATDTVLATYWIENATEKCYRRSNRSSIWKRVDGAWKIIFHQGTPV